jgi:D-tyrosyl-tRNA(Tyr) deacylase
MADKIIKMRIFEDDSQKMNLSVKDIGGDIMVVSQFTLYGDCKKGNRPSFIKSARPKKADLYYNKFIKYLQEKRFKVETGKFGEFMEVELVNSGPTTIVLDV